MSEGRESLIDARPRIVLDVIPVPRGWSPEQAWEAIQRGDILTDKQPGWAVVRTVDGRFVEFLDV